MSSDLNPPRITGFEFRRWLGSGGYADVFLYERRYPKGPVAIKVLRRTDLSSAAVDQFTTEANVMASLEHPYIVPILLADVSSDGRPYLVMRYYPRDNLAVRVRRSRLDVPDSIRVGVKVASAVETAHRAGILHRDIKPANILTNDFGEPGLTDFGISLTKGQAREGAAEGVSLPWAPPEALEEDGVVDERGDVYSLGATIYTLLTARAPFGVSGADLPAQTLAHRIASQAVPRIGRDDVPPALERLLAQAMAKDPDQRPRSALQFARALQDVELAMSLSVTQLVVPAEPDVDAPALDEAADSVPTDLDDAPLTRIRLSKSIDAQPLPSRSIDQEAADSASRPQQLSRSGSSRPHDAGVSQEPGRTTQRPTVRPARARRSWVLAAAGVAVIAAIPLAIALSSSPSKPKAASHHRGGISLTQVVGGQQSTVFTLVATCTRVNQSFVKLRWSLQPTRSGGYFDVDETAPQTNIRKVRGATSELRLVGPTSSTFSVVFVYGGTSVPSNQVTCHAWHGTG